MIKQNYDRATVTGFGQEWQAYDQSCLAHTEKQIIFDSYFSIFPWDKVNATCVGFDVGCGSGRWDDLLAPRVGHLHCCDASADALAVAKNNLAQHANIDFHHCSVDQLPFAAHSMDFGLSLGVLHHVPDTGAALRSCAAVLKPGAPFLLYLYYRFDHKPKWFLWLWQASDLARRVISRTPFWLRKILCGAIAVCVYWPLARGAWLMEKCNLPMRHWPLKEYRHWSLYTLMTDALDRFGTQLEQRFTRPEILAMMQKAGFENITFSDKRPYWVALGYKA